ncbi:Hypothetical predicted protein [Pelobates cultripes]|uniref:Uncharacterized protein n=1 Tax=Pelobates cultripes TaxID=61616 RepID=A0AAD1WC49_PELCU|nr:Hypothetical predicted protein [Pelobates cultripes]
MSDGRKACNSSVAPILRQKTEQKQAPSLEPSLSDSESEMSSQANSERTEAQLTPRDMRGFMADFKKSVAEELDKRLCPIMEGMADLSARAQATETKMAETVEMVYAHGSELQHLREQLPSLKDTNKDLNNRTRRNNVRVRGIPESISTDLLTDTLKTFQNLLPEFTAADLLMNRAHRALRAPSTNAATPRDIAMAGSTPSRAPTKFTLSWTRWAYRRSPRHCTPTSTPLHNRRQGTTCQPEMVTSSTGHGTAKAGHRTPLKKDKQRSRTSHPT